ncbi:unnamed protein product [Effrenium voratum]|nr:unnamed protein product [Effrenium voratum]
MRYAASDALPAFCRMNLVQAQSGGVDEHSQRAADATERDVSAFRHKARVDRGNRVALLRAVWLIGSRHLEKVDAVLQAWRLHVVRCNTRRCCWDEAEARAVAAARAKLLEEGLACWASGAAELGAAARSAAADGATECPRQASPSQLIAHPELFFPSSESSISASSYTSSEGPSSLRPRAQQLAFLRSFRVDVRLRTRAAFGAWKSAAELRRQKAWSLQICGRLQQSERLCWLARCFGSWACAELPRPSSAVLQPTALPSSPSSISRASEAGSGVRSSSAAGPPQPEEEAEEAEEAEAEAAECSAQPEEEQVPDLVFQPILDPKEEASGKSTAPPVADGSERLDSTNFPPVSREESILKRIYLKRTPVLRMVMNRWWEACLSKGMQDLRLPSPQRRAAEPEMRPASPDKSESPLRARRRRAASLARLLEEAEAAAHEAAPAKKAPLRERQLEENLRWGDETWMLAKTRGLCKRKACTEPLTWTKSCPERAVAARWPPFGVRLVLFYLIAFFGWIFRL